MNAQQSDMIAALEQDNIKLRQQIEYLQAQLRPPEPPKREFKYWIVTWLSSVGQRPSAVAATMWNETFKFQDELSERGATHIRILEQVVYI